MTSHLELERQGEPMTIPHRTARARRAATHLIAITALTGLALALSGGVASADALYAAPNPYDGVVPDMTILGAEFNTAWKKLLGAAWGAGFAWAGFGAIRAVLELQRAKRGGYGAQVAENSDSAKASLLTLLALSGLGVIVGAVVSVF